MKRGLFIVTEGIDGCGKSTQAQMLASWFKKRGKKVLLTREPFTDKLRKQLRSGKNYNWLKLFSQDRQIHLKKEVIPALKKGINVICDRYYYSTSAYQLQPDQWENYASKFIKPDLALIFDVPVSIALKRRLERDTKIRQKRSFFERKKILERVRKNYLLLPGVFPEVFILNAVQKPNSIFKNVKNVILQMEKAKNSKKKLQIVISGMPGSGKSTIANHLLRKFGLKHYSVGDFMRQIAREEGKTLLQLSRESEKGFRVDRKLDSLTRSLRNKDRFVIDSRIGWHFLPDSIKIFVRVDIKEASRRIFKAKRGIERENLSYSKTMSNIKRRMKSEGLRYKKYYGIDVNDLSNYDIVIDTTGMSISKMNRVIEAAVRRLLM